MAIDLNAYQKEVIAREVRIAETQDPHTGENTPLVMLGGLYVPILQDGKEVARSEYPPVNGQQIGYRFTEDEAKARLLLDGVTAEEYETFKKVSDALKLCARPVAE